MLANAFANKSSTPNEYFEQEELSQRTIAIASIYSDVLYTDGLRRDTNNRLSLFKYICVILFAQFLNENGLFSRAAFHSRDNSRNQTSKLCMGDSNNGSLFIDSKMRRINWRCREVDFAMHPRDYNCMESRSGRVWFDGEIHAKM